MLFSTKSKAIFTLALLACAGSAFAQARGASRGGGAVEPKVTEVRPGSSATATDGSLLTQLLAKPGAARTYSDTTVANLKAWEKLTDPAQAEALKGIVRNLESRDMGIRSATLKAVNESNSPRAAMAKVAASASAGNTTDKPQLAGDGKKSSVGGMCENPPAVPAGATGIIDKDHPVRDCGLPLDGVRFGYEIAQKVQGDGLGPKDAHQFARFLLEKNKSLHNLGEAYAAVKKIFTECLIPTPHMAQLVNALPM